MLFSFNSSEDESRRHPPPPNCPSFALRNARRVLLHSDPATEGLKKIMEETQLDDLSNAFLLSCHLFEAVRNEMKDDDGHFSMMSYQQVRQVLSDIGEVIGKASMGSRVSNLRIQLSIMQESSLQEIYAALEECNLDVEPASDDDIKMWKRTTPTVRDCLCEGLRQVISKGTEPECALVEEFLRLIDSNRAVLWPQIQQEGLQQPEPDVHRNLIRVDGVDPNDLSRDQRRKLIDEICNCCLRIGIDPAGLSHFLAGSVWIVIGTLEPLSAEQQSNLLIKLDAYVQDCKNSLTKDPSNRCWLFAKSPELVHGAFVPMDILKRIRLIRDLGRRSAAGDVGVAGDIKRPGWTWLDTNGLKYMAMNLHNSSAPTPIVLEQVRLLQQGSELQEDQLLLSTNGLQIIVEQKWEDLTWPEGFLEIMRKISQTQKSGELPWSKSKSFQDFALAVHGICSSNEQICAACLEILQEAHQSEVMKDYKDPHELLTKAQLMRL